MCCFFLSLRSGLGEILFHSRGEILIITQHLLCLPTLVRESIINVTITLYFNNDCSISKIGPFFCCWFVSLFVYACCQTTVDSVCHSHSKPLIKRFGTAEAGGVSSRIPVAANVRHSAMREAFSEHVHTHSGIPVWTRLRSCSASRVFYLIRSDHRSKTYYYWIM